MAQHPAGVGQTVWKRFGCGIQQYLGAAEGRGTEKDHLGPEFKRFLGVGVDHPNTGGSAFFLVVDDAVNHAVGSQRQVAGSPGGGQGTALG